MNNYTYEVHQCGKLIETITVSIPIQAEETLIIKGWAYTVKKIVHSIDYDGFETVRLVVK